MTTITVERTIPFPVGDVFALISDHANYKQFSFVTDSKLVKPGTEHPNGKGAQRIVDLGMWFWVREEITHYEQDKRFDYIFLESSPPIRHQGSRLDFEQVAGGTKVTWTFNLEFDVPLVGTLLTRIATRKITRIMGAFLKAAERSLQAG